ncbi:PRA1 family protein B6 [Cardamine amara subsp. amara]|uniref:PRA1 family protein n=1 Tax=Cardamine amara subsp. amara TaxID=228776 RepID=A0ABD0ZQE1_CARAN
MASPLLPTSTSSDHLPGSDPPLLRSLRVLVSRVVASVRHASADARPWTELVDRSAFSRPPSLSEAASRVRKNFSYFRANYITLVALLLAASLLSHPFALFLLASLAASWLFLYAFRPSDQPLVIGGRTFSDLETLGMLCLCTVVVMFMTSVGSLLMSTLAIGIMAVAIHGAFRAPEDLFLEEQEAIGSGLFAFFNNTASNAAAAAIATSAMSRVRA